MKRFYSLNSVCPKFISNKRLFWKIEVQILEVLLFKHYFFLCLSYLLGLEKSH